MGDMDKAERQDNAVEEWLDSRRIFAQHMMDEFVDRLIEAEMLPPGTTFQFVVPEVAELDPTIPSNGFICVICGGRADIHRSGKFTHEDTTMDDFHEPAIGVLH